MSAVEITRIVTLPRGWTREQIQQRFPLGAPHPKVQGLVIGRCKALRLTARGGEVGRRRDALRPEDGPWACLLEYQPCEHTGDSQSPYHPIVGREPLPSEQDAMREDGE